MIMKMSKVFAWSKSIKALKPFFKAIDKKCFLFLDSNFFLVKINSILLLSTFVRC